MALVQVRRSDVSGVEIPKGEGVRIRVLYSDGRPDRRADMTEEEVEEILGRYLQEVEQRPERRKQQS